jgi:hypothetical protein
MEPAPLSKAFRISDESGSKSGVRAAGTHGNTVSLEAKPLQTGEGA